MKNRMCHLEPPQADVVTPALGERHFQVQVQGLEQQGDVSLDELLLQGDRAGGDHGGTQIPASTKDQRAFPHTQDPEPTFKANDGTSLLRSKTGA